MYQRYFFIVLILISLVGISTTHSDEWIHYKSNPYLTRMVNNGNTLWIGTVDDGLYKFDKTKEFFTEYNSDNSPLTSNIITSLAVSKSGTLWIGTKGLIQYDGNTWVVDTTNASPICISNSKYIDCVKIDSADNVWYGMGDCLVKFNGEKKEFINLGDPAMSHFEIKDILFDRQGYTWVSTSWGLKKIEGIKIIDYGETLYANALALDRSGRLWIANYLGLICVDGINKTLYNSENSQLPDNDIHCLQFDTNGLLWIGTNKGLTRFDGTNWITYNMDNSALPENEIKIMDIDQHGTIWLGLAHYGIIKFDGMNWKNYQLVDRMVPNDAIMDIEIDTDNIIWLGSQGGLIKYDKNGWILYNRVNSNLPNNNIHSLTTDNKGNIWIGNSWMGSEGSCLSIFDGENWLSYGSIADSISFIVSTVSALEVDPEGNLWVGTEYNGLIKFDGFNWTVYNTKNSQLPSDRISQLLHDGKENLWIGTVAVIYYQNMANETIHEGGLVRYNNGEFTIYNKDNSPLPYSSVSALAMDSSGYIWISTYLDDSYWFPNYCGGLTRFNGQNWTTFDTSNTQLTHNWIASIKVDSKNNLWIGSYRDGLIKINTSNEWRYFTTENANILSNHIRALAIDKRDNKWISYGKSEGLSIFREGEVYLESHNNNKIPDGYKLYQNYPNPFNNATMINYQLSQACRQVELHVYNLLGQKVATLVSKKQHAGHHQVKWDASGFASGVYFYQLRTNKGFIQTKKLILLR